MQISARCYLGATAGVRAKCTGKRCNRSFEIPILFCASSTELRLEIGGNWRVGHAENPERGSKSPPRNIAVGRSRMIDPMSLSYRSVCPCRSVAKKQVGKHSSFTSYELRFDAKRRSDIRLVKGICYVTYESTSTQFYIDVAGRLPSDIFPRRPRRLEVGSGVKTPSPLH